MSCILVLQGSFLGPFLALSAEAVRISSGLLLEEGIATEGVSGLGKVTGHQPCELPVSSPCRLLLLGKRFVQLCQPVRQSSRFV